MASIAVTTRRYPVLVFGLSAIILSFATYLLPMPREAVPFLMVLIPTVLGVIFAGMEGGRTGVRALLGKLTQWRISLKWLGIAMIVAIAMRLAMSFIALALGWIPAIRLRNATPGGLVILAVIFLIAALFEELGWRGYALPQLLENHTPLYASLVIGVLWGAVHLTLHLPGMPSQGISGFFTILQLIGLSILLTWFYIRGGQNILLTTFFHAAQSFFVILNEGTSLLQQTWLMAFVWIAAGALVLLFSKSMRVARP